MPACGCPDRIIDGQVQKCACQPCSQGNLGECSCNKETGCSCMNSDSAASTCVCGPSCTCADCSCTKAAESKVGEAPKSCCASNGGDATKKEERAAVSA